MVEKSAENSHISTLSWHFLVKKQDCYLVKIAILFWLQGWELDPHRAAYEAVALPLCHPASVRPAALQAALLF